MFKCERGWVGGGEGRELKRRSTELTGYLVRLAGANDLARFLTIVYCYYFNEFLLFFTVTISTISYYCLLLATLLTISYCRLLLLFQRFLTVVYCYYLKYQS